MLENMENDFIHHESPFSIETFETMKEWNCSMDKIGEFIETDKFQNYVTIPFKDIWLNIMSRLPSSITSILNRPIFFNEECSTIKNSAGYRKRDSFREHDNVYWVGLCPKDIVSRNSSSYSYSCPQLFISIREDFLDYGFYIGSAGYPDSIKMFFNNCDQYKMEMISLLRNRLQEENLIYGFWNEVGKSNYTWIDFISHPRKVAEYVIFKYDVVVSAAYHLKREEVLKTKKEDLVNHILHIFEILYPFLLLAISENPIPKIREYFAFHKEISLIKVVDRTGIKANDLNSWMQSIKRKGQAILYGPPGTGKTFIAENLAQCLIGESDGFSELVQFHPAYSYEDFIEGIRPQSQDGQLKYSLVPGRFLEFCKKADSCRGRCILIIDEINRANLSQVFGELMYLLEYRDKEIPLAGGNTFRIPSNVNIIGTMNTADRSIALVDHALRRRFAFIEIRPNYDVLRNYHENRNTGFKVDGLIKVLEDLNQAIADKNYELGISFFLTEKLAEDIEDIWKMEIEPYLEEYFFDRLEKVDEFRWDKIKQQVLP